MGKLTLDQLTKTKLSKNLVKNATKKGGTAVESLEANCHRYGSDKPTVGCDRLTGSCSPQSGW